MKTVNKSKEHISAALWITYKFVSSDSALYRQEAQLSLTKRSTLFYTVVEELQDFLSENVDKKFTTDYNVA